MKEDKRRKAEIDKADKERELASRRKKEEEEARRRLQQRMRRMRRLADYDIESDSGFDDSEEEYDSLSDGGTIRPRRRKKRYRRYRSRGRRRRRRSEYSESGNSSDSEAPATIAAKSEQKIQKDEVENTEDAKEPPALSTSAKMDIPKDTKKEFGFRDSVFSTFHSMKEAAVKLKYVEAKAKLKKQLETEERIELERKAKIAEANREIRMEDDKEQGAVYGVTRKPKQLIPNLTLTNNRPAHSTR